MQAAIKNVKCLGAGDHTRADCLQYNLYKFDADNDARIELASRTEGLKSYFA